MSVFFLVPLLINGATAYNHTFDRAVQAYQNGDYAAAIELDERLVAEGIVNADVFYNLGNAYYKMGRLGPAMANYERALDQRPGFEMAAYNLAQCVKKTQRRLERPVPTSWGSLYLPWQAGIGPGMSAGLAALFWFVMWLLLGARVLLPVRYLRRMAMLSAALALAFGVTAWAKMHPPPFAVVSQDAVAARLRPEADATVQAQLREGDRVLIERRDHDQALVSTAKGERGWVPGKTLTFVGPPYLRAAIVENTPPHPENAV